MELLSQKQAKGRQEFLLENSNLFGSLGLKESNILGVQMLLGRVKGLSIHYIRISCIYV